MKKLLLFVFIFIGFWVNAQELDEIYIRETLYLADSGVNKITSGNTLATKEYVDANGGAVSFGSQYQIPATNATTDDFNYSAGLTYNDSLNVSGNIIGDTIKANGYIGKNGLGRLIANNKRIADFYSNGIIEQLRINPDGDLTGTAAAPSLAFTNSDLTTDVGLFLLANNNISMVTNSNFMGTITPSGIIGQAGANGYWQLRTISASLTAPSFSFTGDNGTGIHYAAMGQLSLIANTIEAMRLTEDAVFVDSSVHIGKDLIVDGNVGIGTSTPNELLHILSSTNSSVLEVQSTFIGGDARLNLYADNTGLSQLRFGDQDDVNIGLITYDHSDNSMALRTNNATSIFIDSNGDVGINDVTPTFKLDVNGTGRFTGIVNFDVFPITPSSAPTTDYQVANKKYVDDVVASGVMQIASAEIVYTNTSQTTIVTVPSGAIVWDMGVNVSAIFDGTGTNFLDIGTTATPNLITDDFDKLGTVHFPTFLTQNWSGTTVCPIVVGATNITFTYIDQNSDATQGAAIIYIHYFIP